MFRSIVAAFINVSQHMDELFLSPPTLVAMPRAYWLDPNDRVLSSQMMLIQPTDAEFQRLMRAADRDINNANGKIIGDMDIVSDLYKDSGMILPHRPYAILTGEFREQNHTKYLGNSEEVWDADRVLKEAKFVHFSDWPYPKPWIAPPSRLPVDRVPKCVPENCRDREIWLWFYDDFKERMQVVSSRSSSRHVLNPLFRGFAQCRISKIRRRCSLLKRRNCSGLHTAGLVIIRSFDFGFLSVNP